MSEPFTVMERLLLLQFLGDQKGRIRGRIDVLRAVEQFSQVLTFSKAEQEALHFKREGSQVQWSAEAASPVELEVPPLAKVAIQKALRELADANPPLLSLIEMPLWDRFVEGKTPQDSPDGKPSEKAGVEEALPIEAK